MSKSGVKLQLSNISKSWGDVEVLDDISLEVQAGTFLTLLGPSGCGKSTALRLIAGLDSVSNGKIIIDDEDVTNLSPAERNIGMVFQNYALFPHMTVRRNILYGLRVRRVPLVEQKRNLERVTDLMGLSELLQRYPAQLSGGQQQRVALARVLVANRPLVLMDEPLSNLDAKLRVEIRSEIRELNKKLGITIVYVTHDQSEALSMSDQVLLMNKGRASQFGSPSTIYSHPKNTFAANFIGTPPMNLIKASSLSPGALGYRAADAESLLVGIRPEDIILSDKPTPLGLKGKITNAEYEGLHTLVTIVVNGDEKVITSIPKSLNFELGAVVHLNSVTESMYLFNIADGQLVPFNSALTH